MKTCYLEIIYLDCCVVLFLVFWGGFWHTTFDRRITLWLPSEKVIKSISKDSFTYDGRFLS